ncbi:protein kinase family protein [Nocardioides zeae]|uniref:Protein kinase domain-containing protein n=1 Tax=Nocardioides zeae TaxID=1457234 RepID=A0AAJ1U9N8_9ACTN|nr:protein kinase family protein [Nocardioides zeae]MDQ1106107.1 hypothetical protein [Nocardioides zeae]
MPTTIRPGDVLANRYLLIDLLSETGDGRFWRAHDRVLGRHVSVHVIPSGTPRAEVLLDAARGCARLTDRRFLRVLDAEVKNGVTYVVTEWGTGTSLQLMLQHAPLAPRRAAWLVGEVAGAMAAAHAAGVCHGRLVPENIIVDLSGTVRIVGAQVDAALKGLPTADERGDVHELVSLLYAGLTGRWPGRSPSEMPAAPLENGSVLRPRQVRAGIPRVLDELCDDVLNADAPPRAPYDLATARGIADYLREYVGDPASMAAAEAERGSTATSGLPTLPPELLDPLPPVLPHDARPAAGPSTPSAPAVAPVAAMAVEGATTTPPAHDPLDGGTAVRPVLPAESGESGDSGAAAAPAEEPAAGSADQPAPARARAASTGDVPTQAGVPIFDEEADEVSWLAKRAEPPPPPPDFEPPPERPLFAPETPEEIEARRRRAAAESAATSSPTAPAAAGNGSGSDDYWPWATGHTTGAVIPHPVREPGARRNEKPGRTWLQLAGFLGALVALLLVVALAYQILGSSSDDGGGSGSTASSDSPSSPLPSSAPTPITGITAVPFDPPPDGNGEENDDSVPNALDGDPATSWNTLTYRQQLGPSGLKSGVGLQLDLGTAQNLRQVRLDLTGSPTSVSVYVTADPVTSVEDLEAAGSADITGEEGTIDLAEGTTGQYVTVWLTSLPSVSGGFRGEIAEVQVLG